MFKTYLSVAVAAALALSAGSALAANNTATITIGQLTESLSGLLVGTNNNLDFTLLNGEGTSGYFQNGNLVSKTNINTSHGDYWIWEAGKWNMRSTTSDKLMLSLTDASGLGDPQLSFGLIAYNTSGANQNYTFTVSSTIAPPVTSGFTASAKLVTAGNPLTFDPSVINGSVSNVNQTFTLDGVYSPNVNFNNYGGFGVFNKNASYLGNTTTYTTMQLSTSFTLAGDSNGMTTSAVVSSLASITPVPEPESYAMMLSGIALLAGMARRRKI
jgi:hypothetical protein